MFTLEPCAGQAVSVAAENNDVFAAMSVSPDSVTAGMVVRPITVRQREQVVFTSSSSSTLTVWLYFCRTARDRRILTDRAFYSALLSLVLDFTGSETKMKVTERDDCSD